MWLVEQEEDDRGEGAHDDVVLQPRVHRVPTNEGRQYVQASVADPWRFCVDPDLDQRIYASE